MSVVGYLECDDLYLVQVFYDGVYSLLTPCCNASGKGGEHGVICRACYDDVDFIFGACWLPEEWETEAERLGYTAKGVAS
jgi:hypothetical protein